MARPAMPSFHELPLGGLRYDPAELVRCEQGSDNRGLRQAFETLEECVREDLWRASCLVASGLSGARRLGELLGESELGFAHETWASRRYCRGLRQMQVDGLLRLMDEHGDEELSCFTMVLPDWCVADTELAEFDVGKETKAVGRRLSGASSAAAGGGWLFGQMHGEFDSSANRFQLHLHGICSRELVPGVREIAHGQSTARIYRPVRIDAVRGADRARQVSYMLQSYWPHRPRVRVDDEWRRVRRKGRIPEPWGSMALLWLHRQSYASMQVKLGLQNSWRVARAGNSG